MLECSSYQETRPAPCFEFQISRDRNASIVQLEFQHGRLLPAISHLVFMVLNVLARRLGCFMNKPMRLSIFNAGQKLTP